MKTSDMGGSQYIAAPQQHRHCGIKRISVCSTFAGLCRRSVAAAVPGRRLTAGFEVAGVTGVADGADHAIARHGGRVGGAAIAPLRGVTRLLPVSKDTPTT